MMLYARSGLLADIHILTDIGTKCKFWRAASKRIPDPIKV